MRQLAEFAFISHRETSDDGSRLYYCRAPERPSGLGRLDAQTRSTWCVRSGEYSTSTMDLADDLTLRIRYVDGVFDERALEVRTEPLSQDSYLVCIVSTEQYGVWEGQHQHLPIFRRHTVDFVHDQLLRD